MPRKDKTNHNVIKHKCTLICVILAKNKNNKKQEWFACAIMQSEQGFWQEI